jgi:hypothetical protein
MIDGGIGTTPSLDTVGGLGQESDASRSDESTGGSESE